MQLARASRYGGVRRAGQVAGLGLGLIWPVCGMAQTAPSDAAISKGVAPHAVEASVSHSAAKGITLKAMSVTAGTVIYAIGTGSLAAGGLLSVINGAGSYVIYVTNEYLWDYYSPNTNVSANNASFQTTSSLTRNTKKYLTFKPAVTVLNVGTIYWFSETLAATAGMSAGAIFMLPVVFYANNVLWDWYDWHGVPPETATAQVTADNAR